LNVQSRKCDSGSGPLFVVGLWRSGTSLLYTLLNQHPQIALLYEGDLFLLRSLFRPGNKGDWLGRWEFWNSALSRHRIDKKRMPAEVPDFPTAAMAVWEEYAGHAQVLGEKSPDYYDCMHILARDFPSARFLVIWRDLADTCRSMVRARSGSTFFSKPGLLHRAIIGYHKMKIECDALSKQRIPLHQIQYEELIQDPTRVMQGICEFLGLEFEPRMASLEGSDRSAIYQGAHHERVKGEAIVNSGKDEEVLPAPVKNKIERYVAYWHKRYGGNWPVYPKPANNLARRASSAERVADEMLFRALRAMDSFTQLVYCYAPYKALEKYRAAKSRRFREAESAKGVPEQPPVENVHS
jgi:Sulfotransferase family